MLSLPACAVDSLLVWVYNVYAVNIRVLRRHISWQKDMAKTPKFATLQEEADFWDTHDSTDYLDDTTEVDGAFVDVRPRKAQISLRLDPWISPPAEDGGGAAGRQLPGADPHVADGAAQPGAELGFQDSRKVAL